MVAFDVDSSPNRKQGTRVHNLVMGTLKIIQDPHDQTKTQKAYKKVQRNPQLQRIEGFSVSAARLNLPLPLAFAFQDDIRIHRKQSSQAE